MDAARRKATRRALREQKRRGFDDAALERRVKTLTRRYS